MDDKEKERANMFQLNNFLNNQNMKVIDQKGPFRVFEHEKDLSVNPANAVAAYFASEMNVRKRQVFVELNGNGCITQAGAMQWMLGNVNMGSGVKGVGNLLGKMASAAVTKETMIGDLLRIDAGVAPILLSIGMHCLGCPSSQGETIAEAAMVHGIDPDALVNEINNFLAKTK